MLLCLKSSILNTIYIASLCSVTSFTEYNLLKYYMFLCLPVLLQIYLKKIFSYQKLYTKYPDPVYFYFSYINMSSNLSILVLFPVVVIRKKS